MAFLGTLLKVVGFLPSILVGIEGLFGSNTGSQKKETAISLIGTILGLTEGIANKDIVDQGGFIEGLKQAIDGVVKMLNCSVWAKR